MDAPPAGVIHGFVRDDIGRPFEGLQVDLISAQGIARSTNSNPDGSFRFIGLPGARYTVRLNSDKVPDGYLGPWRQNVPSPGQGNDYQAKVIEMPDNGKTFEIELLVFAKSTTWGIVVGPDGEPVANFYVRLQGAASSGQPSSLNATTRTDSTGRFEMGGVYPGKYLLHAWPSEDTLEFYHTQPAPIPRAIEIAASGTYDLGVIQLGAGKNTVVGRVVDELGVPFKDLPVIAYPSGSPGEGYQEYGMSSVVAQASTNSDGFYRLEQIPDITINIHVGADYMREPLGKAQAAFWVAPLEVRLSGSRVTTVQERVLPRSRPFRIFGAVKIDEEWGKNNSVAFEDIAIVADLLDPDSPPVPNRPNFHIHQKHKVDPKTGQFEILLETPHHPVRITFD